MKKTTSFKVFTFLLILLSSCGIQKTYHENAVLQSKKFSVFGRTKSKLYNNSGKLLIIKKAKSKNNVIITSDGKEFNEQITVTKVKGFYERGFRKLKYSKNTILTDKGFFYKLKFKEYNYDKKLILEIQYNYFDSDPKSKIWISEQNELDLNETNYLIYLNKFNTDF
jgi:hypothetical protein